MNYPYSVSKMKVEDHEFWVAKCPALKGCIGQGDTLDEAVRELESNADEWLSTAQELGLDIPPVPTETAPEYSGRLTLRISPYEHEQAAAFARLEGVSLNQYISDAVVARNREFKLQTT